MANLKTSILSWGTYLYSLNMGEFPCPPPFSEVLVACECLQRIGWVTVLQIEKLSLQRQHKFIIFLFTSIDKDLFNYGVSIIYDY